MRAPWIWIWAAYSPANLTFLALSGPPGPAAAWFTLEQIQPAGFPVIVAVENPTPIANGDDNFSLWDVTVYPQAN